MMREQAKRNEQAKVKAHGPAMMNSTLPDNRSTSIMLLETQTQMLRHQSWNSFPTSPRDFDAV